MRVRSKHSCSLWELQDPDFCGTPFKRQTGSGGLTGRGACIIHNQGMLVYGFPGVATAVGLLAIIWVIVYLRTKGQPVVFHPGGKHGEFGKRLLPMYLDITKFVLGLAAGSIVLLVSSLNFNQSNARSLKSFASPLFLMAIICYLVQPSDYISSKFGGPSGLKDGSDCRGRARGGRRWAPPLKARRFAIRSAVQHLH